MKFTANRKIMLEYLKTMIRIVPKNSTVKELMGFLIEANDDDGYLYLTANNLENAMQRKFKPEIENGGSFVMEAKMLTDILTLLGGDNVVFEEISPGIIEIRAENCVYTIKVFDSSIYPRPEIPFPDSTVSICNIKQMYSKTSATVGDEATNEAFRGIHFHIDQNGFKLESCNIRDIAIATKKMSSGGTMDFVLSKQTVSCLSSAAGDEELEVGMCGPFVVFMKEGMLFSTKKFSADFVDTSKLLGRLQIAYTAAADGEVFKREILSICDVASVGSEPSFVKLEFNETSINLSTVNETGCGTGVLNCITVNSTCGLSFYYTAADLKNIFRTVEGRMMLQVDKRGYLLVEDMNNKYMLTPMSVQAAQKQLERIGKQKRKEGTNAA